MQPLNWRFRISLLILGLCTWWPVLKGGFLWDDHFTIQANPYITRWSLANIRHDFSSGLFNAHGEAGTDLYRPLQTLTNRLDYSLFGQQPWGYHLTNVAFHLLNGWLLAELVVVLGFSPLTAWLCGIFFLVHPVIVSELLMISGRSEPMCFSFSLLAFLCLISDHSWGGLGAATAFALALLSKESAVLIPVQFGLIVWGMHLPFRKLNRLAYFILPLAVYIALYRHAMTAVEFHLDPWLVFQFFIKAFPKIVLHYVRIVLFPWHLYSDPLLPLHDPYWGLYLGLLIGAPVWFWKKKQDIGLFCFAWFILGLLPKSVLMITQGIMLDHWIYPSLPAVLLPMAIVAAKHWESSRTPMRWAARSVSGGVVIFWIFLSQLNIALRNTDEKLFRWSLRFRTLPIMRENLGFTLLAAERPLEAVLYLQNIQPDQLINLPMAESVVMAYWKTGQPHQAIQLLDGLIHAHQNEAEALRSLRSLQQKLLPGPIKGLG